MMSVKAREMQAAAPVAKGAARCPDAPTTQEIIAKDRAKAPDWVRSQRYEFLGDDDISTERYVSAAFAQREYQTLWKKTWQIACREEHIPEVGDYYVYDIGRYSFLITRVAEDEVRAYYNACLHRGTKLRASGTQGTATEFRCSFHGWSWNVDGSNKRIMCPWDFPHVDAKQASLPQARVERLGGFVFINMDCDAPSLADYLGPEGKAHMDAWKLQDRYVHLHVVKRMAANWKLVVAAFAEGYHVISTHPQVAVSCADANMEYDVYGDHFDRFISAMGVLSPHLEGQYTEQGILDLFTLGDSSALEGVKRVVPPGGTARQIMADMYREMIGKAHDRDMICVSDSELLDCFSYTLFPSAFLFPGVSFPMVYRFRPDKDDHRKSLFEVWFLRPVPESGARPLTAEPILLRDDQSFAEAEGMDPGFAQILDQDTANLALQQEGIDATACQGLTLGNYQEIRIRNFERSVDRYVGTRD